MLELIAWVWAVSIGILVPMYYVATSSPFLEDEGDV